MAFLDFGIGGRLSGEARAGLLVALAALLAPDLRMAAAMISTPEGAAVDLAANTANLERVVLPMPRSRRDRWGR